MFVGFHFLYDILILERWPGGYILEESIVIRVGSCFAQISPLFSSLLSGVQELLYSLVASPQILREKGLPRFIPSSDPTHVGAADTGSALVYEE
jgi:hypothetical protein